MQTLNIRRKIGTPYINDTETGIIIPLPTSFNILTYSSNIWLGGSTDGQLYLHAERYNSASTDIPNILADGDLDMTMVSVGDEDIWQNDVKGIQIKGTLGPKSMHGYLMQWNMSEDQHFLIMLASAPEQYSAEIAHQCYQIIQNVKSQLAHKLAA